MYTLAGIRVLTGTTVHRVKFECENEGAPKASIVLLADVRRIKARKEIILAAAGASRTPQILMLSGHLIQHDISVVVDAPHALARV